MTSPKQQGNNYLKVGQTTQCRRRYKGAICNKNCVCHRLRQETIVDKALKSAEENGYQVGHLAPQEEWEKKVFELVGEASMCWDSTGSAIFDTDRALKVSNAFIALIRKELEAAQQETLNARIDSIKFTLDTKNYDAGRRAGIESAISRVKELRDEGLYDPYDASGDILRYLQSLVDKK